jgi:hypothetical protein
MHPVSDDVGERREQTRLPVLEVDQWTTSDPWPALPTGHPSWTQTCGPSHGGRRNPAGAVDQIVLAPILAEILCLARSQVSGTAEQTPIAAVEQGRSSDSFAPPPPGDPARPCRRPRSRRADGLEERMISKEGTSAGNDLQRLTEVADQIAGVLEADGESEQGRIDGKGGIDK